jgi:hypothetical protein
MAEVTQLTTLLSYWKLAAEGAWERDKHPSVCPESEDKIHCDHWRFDLTACCDCGKTD